VAEVPLGGTLGAATHWLVDASRSPDGVIDLGPASPVVGVSDAVSFLTRLDDGTTCTTIATLELGGDWKETCWFEAPTPQVVTDWDGMVVQFDLTDPMSIVAHPLDDGPAWPQSGCTVSDIGEMIARSGFEGSLFTSVECAGTAAASTEGSMLLQPGPVDGTIWLYERIDDTWQPVDNGTGIETDLGTAVPPYEEWATLTGS
jgi:hypothetical protein